MSASQRPEEPITKDTIATALGDLQADLNRQAPNLLTRIAGAAGAGAAALIGVAYLAGRRAGRKRSAVVEVRRI